MRTAAAAIAAAVTLLAIDEKRKKAQLGKGNCSSCMLLLKDVALCNRKPVRCTVLLVVATAPVV
jgi:hypothetical protein